MNKEEIVCSPLDNVQNPQQDVGNFNDTVSHEDQVLSECNKVLKKNESSDHVSEQAGRNQEQEEDNREENDIEEYDIDALTGSYVEISLDQEFSAIRDDGSSENKDSQSSKTTEEEEERIPALEKKADGSQSQKEKMRPNSLVLSKNSVGTVDHVETEMKLATTSLSEKGETWKRIHRSQQTSDSQTTSIDGSPSLSSEEFAIYSPGHRRTGSDTSGLSDLQGTITVDGDMVSFVAEDLQEKIKLSSPVSRWAESSSYPGSRSSTPSLYKQALQSHMPLVDAGAIADLEVHACKVASCVDTMLENLSGTLLSISSLTVDCMETYETSACKTCDSVDTSIKTMYQLIAKVEELSNSVKPLYKISQDIKEMKKVLDYFESVVEHKS